MKVKIRNQHVNRVKVDLSVDSIEDVMRYKSEIDTEFPESYKILAIWTDSHTEDEVSKLFGTWDRVWFNGEKIL